MTTQQQLEDLDRQIAEVQDRMNERFADFQRDQDADAKLRKSLSDQQIKLCRDRIAELDKV